MIKDFKRTQLEENWSEYNFGCMEGDEVTLAHYACNEANNDPGFYRWLFDDDELSDFECGDEREFKDYVLSIMVDEDADDYDVNEWLKLTKTNGGQDYEDNY